MKLLKLYHEFNLSGWDSCLDLIIDFIIKLVLFDKFINTQLLLQPSGFTPKDYLYWDLLTAK